MAQRAGGFKVTPQDYRVRVSLLARARFGREVTVTFWPGRPCLVLIAEGQRLLCAGQGVKAAVRGADARRAS